MAQADRRHAVRSAAEAWRHAGAIDDATLRAIATAYPDDRVRLGVGLRMLAGGAALVGGLAFAGLLFAVFGDSSIGSMFSLFLAIVFTVATELQTGRLRRANAGAEFATAILAAGFAGGWIAFLDFHSGFLICCGFALTFALAAWRWGYASLAVAAAILVLCAAAQQPFGRLIWLGAGFAALPLILGLARSPRWPPAHRRGFLAAGVVFLVGAYAAANLFSLDHRSIEWTGHSGSGAPAAGLRVAAMIATILMPPLVLIAGVRRRERVLLAAGALFAAASLATLRHYHPIGPWWLLLVLGGMACLTVAVALRRWLDKGDEHERSGFTAVPLFEQRGLVEAAQAAAVVAALSPSARVAPEDGFSGGGGRSGGGGATGTT